MKTPHTSAPTPSSNAVPSFLHGDRMRTSLPEDYVTHQRQFNSFHSDGSAIAWFEETKSLADTFLKLVAQVKSPKRSFLDLGCRLGYCLPHFEEAYPQAKVLGCDIVPEFVEAAQSFGDAVVADMHDLPFKDGEFDYIFCAQTLEHAYNPQKAADEICRVAACGFLVGIPLESREGFEGNLSHYAYTDNPITWLRLFENQKNFRLFYAMGSNLNQYMNFLFLRINDLPEEVPE